MMIGDRVTHPALPPAIAHGSRSEGRVVSFDSVTAVVEGYPGLQTALYFLPLVAVHAAQTAQAKLLAYCNAERAREGGLPAFRADQRLETAAQAWAIKMAATGVLQHGDFSARIRAAGYLWTACAENIADGQPIAETVFAAWMSSDGHRANILGPCRDVGFGRANDAQGRVWWCADFGSE
jgi:uncharacterized protein YkwD